MFLGHGHRVPGIFDSQRDAETRAGIQRRSVDASSQSSSC
jgi:hypothetical protein